MKKIRFGIEIGKEAREIDISLRDWQRIQKGEKVSLSMLNYYEADEFEYCFRFNYDKKGSLFVGYTSVDDERQQGDGFIGNISDGWVNEIG